MAGPSGSSSPDRASAPRGGGAPDPREQGIADLLKRLSEETTTLVRQELELAKAEVTQKGRQAGLGAGLVGGAGIMALLTAGALTAFLIAVLDTFLATWLAALLVTLVYGAITAVLALRGKQELQEAAPPKPEQTIETLKEDAQWARTRPRSGAR